MTSSTDLEIRRRRARFRSWHRGMREVDLILGNFADREMVGLDEPQVAEFERLLDIPDAELLRWITGEAPVPEQFATPLFGRIADYRQHA